MIRILEENEPVFSGSQAYSSAQELVDMILELPTGEYLLCIEENQALKRAAARLRKEMVTHGSGSLPARSLPNAQRR